MSEHKNRLEGLLLAVFNGLKKVLRIQFLDFQKFKYLLAGSFNVGLSWVLYFVFYNFILRKANVDLFGIITISPHIFSFLLSFAITFFTGFFLNYLLVFNGTPQGGRVYRKLLKYFISTIGSVLINYFLLKLFVEMWGWYPTPSQMLATCIVTVYSYLAQQKFTFAQRRRHKA